jgi:hypothetical protein
MHSFAASSRSCYAGVNRPGVDLDVLLCQHLRMDRPLEEIRKVVERSAQQPGWLVFYAHDVSDAPSCGGCTPEYFESVLRIVADKCRILTVRDALSQIRGCEAAPSSTTTGAAA